MAASTNDAKWLSDSSDSTRGSSHFSHLDEAPRRMLVTNRIITFLVGDPHHKPAFDASEIRQTHSPVEVLGENHLKLSRLAMHPRWLFWDSFQQDDGFFLCKWSCFSAMQPYDQLSPSIYPHSWCFFIPGWFLVVEIASNLQQKPDPPRKMQKNMVATNY